MCLARVLRLLLCVALVIGFAPGAPHARAQSEFPVPTAGEPSTTAPPGYVAQPLLHTAAATAAASAGADILLIETALPWNSNADTQVLDQLHYSYQIVDMSNLDSVDLFAYRVILIVNDQVQSFYDRYAGLVSRFEGYVQGGGMLVFFAASNGWANGTLTAPLPGGVRLTTPSLQQHNYIADPQHPIITRVLSENQPMIDGDWYSNSCSHGYFSNLPADARVILREPGGNPTLAEYSLGGGKVIASTQTWEHNWYYYSGGGQYGAFAAKALDDVFLYAFSSGGKANAKIDLHIDDAPTQLAVNKSRGSYIDVVARVDADAAYPVSVTLQVPANTIGVPLVTFTRTRPGDPQRGVENQFTTPVAGQYVISDTLAGADSQFHKEYIWRFKTPDQFPAGRTVDLTVKAAIPNRTTSNLAAQAQVNIIDQARAIIVTNRTLLYARFQPDPAVDDVSPLLNKVFQQADLFNGEVFYVDLYNDKARQWDQQVDYASEANANAMAFTIDSLIDDWYHRLDKQLGSGPRFRPAYLLIVGGDEIIPYYRTDDRTYYTAMQKAQSKPGCSADSRYDLEYACINIGSDDPVAKVPANHYFLSDNIYADVGGNLQEWQAGWLELAVGRIVGDSARTMTTFIDNAWRRSSQSISQAVLASRAATSEVTGARARLQAAGISIYGDSDPDLTENDGWSRSQWITALEQPYQLLGYEAHGAYNGWYGTGKWGTLWGLIPWGSRALIAKDQPTGVIAENRPLFVVDACNFGLPARPAKDSWTPDANITYKLAALGASGLVASTAIAYDATNGVRFAEWLENAYFQNLLAVPSHTADFGVALLRAKQNYPPALLDGEDGNDRKTVMEFVYYGLPWSSTGIFANPQQAAAPASTSYSLTGLAPQQTGANSYSKLISAAVAAHQFVATDGFELLTIPGSDTIYSAYKPVLPMLRTVVTLPPGSTVAGVELVSEHGASLGAHLLPAADPVTPYSDASGYTATTDVTGLYPDGPRFGYQVVDRGDWVEVRVNIAPATYNVTTHEVTLYDSTVLRVNYQADSPVVLSNVTVGKQLVEPNATLTFGAEAANVSAAAVTGQLALSIYDAAGNPVDAAAPVALSLAAGAGQPVSLQAAAPLRGGSYTAVLTLAAPGAPMMAGSTSFTVLDGKVTNLAAPEFVRFGTFGKIDLTFANLGPAAVDASARVRIYDQGNVEVASLLQRTLNAPAAASATFSWNWDPAGLPAGEYRLRSEVTAGSKLYFGPTASVRVGAVDPPPTISFADTYFVTLENGGSGVALVRLSRPSAEPVTVNFNTADGTAHVDSDYRAVAAQVTFAPGETEKSVPVPLVDDSIDEYENTILLHLSSPGNAILGSIADAQMLIEDNDPPPSVGFTASSYAVNETAGQATIAVRLSSVSGKFVRVSYRTVDGDALAGRDYEDAAGLLLFEPGEQEKLFTVRIIDLPASGPSRSLSLALTSVNDAMAGAGAALLTINDVAHELHLYLPRILRR